MIRIDDLYRLPKYQKDPRQEEQLRQINQALAPLEQELTQFFTAPQLPVVFVVGAPRSGTTLLAQALAATGAFEYASNFLARLWMAPFLGAKMEKAIGIRDGNAATSYKSEFGVTEGWADPHEFGYFWERWFTFVDTHKLTPEALAQVEGHSLQRELAALESVRGKPLFFKSLVCSPQVSFLASLLPNSVFVVCLREPIYNAQSLLRGRENRLGSKEHWFSLRPGEYQQLVKLPHHEQVAAQIQCTLRDIQTSLTQINPSRSMGLRYEEFCAQPRDEVQRMIQFVESHGCKLESDLMKIPERFPSANVQKVDDRDFRLLKDACKKFPILGLEGLNAPS